MLVVVFLASIVSTKWKQLKFPKTYEWINQIWYTHTHTMEYHLAIKRINY